MNRMKRELTFPEEITKKSKEYNDTRANKPLTERRRRERINNSLDQLKHTILNGSNIPEKKYAKMEKADILELAVRYIKDLQRQEQTTATSMGEFAQNSYREGYSHCLQEVLQFLSLNPCISEEVKQHLCTQLLQRSHQSVHILPHATEGNGTSFSPVFDISGYSSGYSSSGSTDSMVNGNSRSRSSSRASSVSDSCASIPLAASTPLQFTRDGTTMGTPVSPFEPDHQFSPSYVQQTLKNGYDGHCSDNNSYRQYSDSAATHTAIPGCNDSTSEYSSKDTHSDSAKSVWRPW